MNLHNTPQSRSPKLSTLRQHFVDLVLEATTTLAVNHPPAVLRSPAVLEAATSTSAS